MTQDDVIEMARDSGMELYGLGKNRARFVHHLVAFAHLVADKATEEANAKANASWTLMCKKMVAIEREACAKACDEKVDAEYATGKVDHNEMGWTQSCAIAIRARGEQALAQPEQDGECKYCTHGCAACDARKLQKEAHDLL